MRSEYVLDYSAAVRGKYHKRLTQEGANVVVLDPDVAKVFHDSAAVIDALRGLLPSRSAPPRANRRLRTRVRTRRAAD